MMHSYEPRRVADSSEVHGLRRAVHGLVIFNPWLYALDPELLAVPSKIASSYEFIRTVSRNPENCLRKTPMRKA